MVTGARHSCQAVHWARRSSSTHAVSGPSGPPPRQAGGIVPAARARGGDGPAQESLDRQDLPGAQVELRLVVQDQVALADAGRNSSSKSASGRPPCRGPRSKWQRGVAQLGPVHGDVGAPDEPGAVAASAGAMAMPMLALMLALTTSSTKGSARGWRRPGGHFGGVLGVRVDQDDGELVASESHEEVGVAQ